MNDLGLDWNPDSYIQESLDPNPYPDLNKCLGYGDWKCWANREIYYADDPEEGFPWHRPQELVGRCRLNKNKTKLFVTEKYNQDLDLHVSALA
jgi:hypothetical protein